MGAGVEAFPTLLSLKPSQKFGRWRLAANSALIPKQFHSLTWKASGKGKARLAAGLSSSRNRLISQEAIAFQAE
jgi:hypothetical protein